MRESGDVHMIGQEPPAAERRTDRARRAVLLVVLLFVAYCGAAGVRGVSNNRVAADQDLFHLPVVRQFAAQLPWPDLRDYASATAPGYHLILAFVDRFVSDNVIVLRCCGGLFGVLLIGLLAGVAARRSAWLALPVAASVYVVTSTVWMLPENAAWALVVAALGLALYARGRTPFLGSAVVIALLVFVRQSHVWTLLPLAAAAFAGVWQGDGRGRPGRSVLYTLLAGVPAVAVLAWLVWLWHGLTPPAFQPDSDAGLRLATRVGGFAPAAPAMVLSLVGLFGVPLLAWLTPAGNAPRWRRVACLGGAMGFLLGVLPVSTYAWNRRSGIWNVVRVVPTAFDRSPVIVGLATIGGAVAAVTLLGLPLRARLVLAAALIGFTLVQMANVLLWQRYYEPFVLIWLVLAASASTAAMNRRRQAWGTAGLAVLTLFQVAAAAYTLTHAG